MKLQTLLEKTSELDIFLRFLPNLDEANIRKSGNSGRNISSPFVTDNHPSFSIYETADRKLKFKCHSSGQAGDCFQLVADLHNLDCRTQFQEVLKLVNKEMKLGIENNMPATYTNQIWKAEYYGVFSKPAIVFWKTRKVDMATLERFRVKQLTKLVYNKKAVNDYHYHKTVAFEFTVNGRKKLYVPAGPNPKVKKRYFFKTQLNADIFGLRQLPKKKQKFILICEGEGDVLCAAAHGLPAVCFQSATTMPTRHQMRTLRRKGSNLILCYDLDDAGRKAASKITWKYQSVIDLKIPKDSTHFIDEDGVIQVYENEALQKEKVHNKDLSDWLPHSSVHEFRNLIDKTIKDNRCEGI